MIKFNPVRGTHDLLNESLQKHNYIISIFNELACKFNFRAIDTPIIENIITRIKNSVI